MQVYEYTGGLAPGEPVAGSGVPLTAELGPGLLGGVFDGMLRPLVGAPALLGGARRAGRCSRDRRWAFAPAPRAGEQRRRRASCSAPCAETPAIEHRVLVPPGVAGTRRVDRAAPGDYRVDAPVARIGGAEVTLAQRWPVRMPRPYAGRLRRRRRSSTGQRVLDLLYPGGARQHRRRARAASAPARPCCCSRSPSGATPT